VDSADAFDTERRYYRLAITFAQPWRPSFFVSRAALRFSGEARRVIALAGEEAGALGHNYVGTEHLLLGLIREGGNSGATVLESLGISLGAVRQQVEEIIGKGPRAPSGAVPFTPRARKTLELSQREALRTGDRHVGGDHILAGLIWEGEGVAAQVLIRLGADLGRVRQQLTLLGHRAQETSSPRVTGMAPPPADAGLHSVHYRLRPSRADTIIDPAPSTDAESPLLQAILTRLDSIDSRLSVIEKHLGAVPEEGDSATGTEP
jgi:ATP-dependent Clp protease ATP-binding subunit ClpC